MLKWADNAYGIKFVALRYFNAAGAHISGKIGEDHSPETHLIPIILQTALGQREKMVIFGWWLWYTRWNLCKRLYSCYRPCRCPY